MAREGESGLSMIEALVLVVITAMVALMVLPMAQTSSRNNVNLATRQIDVATAQRGEATFRALLGDIIQPQPDAGQPIVLARGDTASLSAVVATRRRSLCAEAGLETVVTLQIVVRGNGGALLCTQNGRRVTLAAWPRGRAAFAYSADGATWSRDWPAAAVSPDEAAAPVVRFSVQGGAPPLRWLARAGWTEPAREEAPGAQTAQTTP